MANEVNFTICNIKVKNVEDYIQALNNEPDLLKWQFENGYKDEVIKSTSIHLLFSLLSDIYSYLDTSFHAINYKNVFVAFDLLRKPLKDSLYLIEWLVVDNNELCKRIIFDNTTNYDPSNRRLDPSKREILNKILELVHLPEPLSNSNYMYDLRYSSKPVSLQRVWNNTSHIVTQAPNWKTPKQSLNFIFRDKKIDDSFVNYYYNTIPNIMVYIDLLVQHILSDLIETTPESDYINFLNFLFEKYIYTQRKLEIQKLNTTNDTELDKIYLEEKRQFVIMEEHFLNLKSMELLYKCTCAETLEVSDDFLRRLVTNQALSCARCSSEINGNRYFINEFICC